MKIVLLLVVLFSSPYGSADPKEKKLLTGGVCIKGENGTKGTLGYVHWGRLLHKYKPLIGLGAATNIFPSELSSSPKVWLDSNGKHLIGEGLINGFVPKAGTPTFDAASIHLNVLDEVTGEWSKDFEPFTAGQICFQHKNTDGKYYPDVGGIDGTDHSYIKKFSSSNKELNVKKCSCGNQVSMGKVVDWNAALEVPDPRTGRKMSIFNLIKIKGTNTDGSPFRREFDSGALVVTENPRDSTFLIGVGVVVAYDNNGYEYAIPFNATLWDALTP